MRVTLVGAHRVAGESDMRRLDVELYVSLRSLLGGAREFVAAISVEGIAPRIDATAALRFSDEQLSLSLDGALDDGSPVRLVVRTDLRGPTTRALSELSGELSVGAPSVVASRVVLRADVFHESLKWGWAGLPRLRKP